jgi:hypothetical protein
MNSIERLPMSDRISTFFAAELPVANQQPSTSMQLKGVRMALCLCLALVGTGCGPHLTTKTDNVVPVSNKMPSPMFNDGYSADAKAPFVVEPRTAMAGDSKRSDFGSERASRRTRDMADWVVNSGDNRNLPFAIVDKIDAKVYVFGEDGKLNGAAPVLLGIGKGDDVAPGVGSMRMGLIPPEHRTTPAGRFEARMGRNAKGKEILWVDYDNAISMHPVVTSNPKERRLERLNTPTPDDNRISFGCINVPTDFFKNVVHSAFSGTSGIVYVLPETKSYGET